MPIPTASNLIVLGFRREAELWQILNGKIDQQERDVIERVVGQLSSGVPVDEESFRLAIIIIRQAIAMESQAANQERLCSGCTSAE